MDEHEMNNQQPNNSTPEEIGGQGEKLFTQADLDRIIGERLSRAEKKDAGKLDEREKALAKRESALQCREYILEKGYPSELLDVLDTSDTEDFKQRADKAVHAFGRPKQPVAPLADPEIPIGSRSELQSAFSRNRKHIPRAFPPLSDEE